MPGVGRPVNGRGRVGRARAVGLRDKTQVGAIRINHQAPPTVRRIVAPSSSKCHSFGGPLPPYSLVGTKPRCQPVKRNVCPVSDISPVFHWSRCRDISGRRSSLLSTSNAPPLPVATNCTVVRASSLPLFAEPIPVIEAPIAERRMSQLCGSVPRLVFLRFGEAVIVRVSSSVGGIVGIQAMRNFPPIGMPSPSLSVSSEGCGRRAISPGAVADGVTLRKP